MPKPPPTPPADSPEGPRSFTFFLDKLASGDAAAELSRDLQTLVLAIKNEARMRETKIKGNLTLKLAFELDGNDDVPVMLVHYEVTSKLPKPARRKGHFWTTDGGNLTTEAPKQEPLPGLQEIEGGKRAPRDVGADSRATREA